MFTVGEEIVLVVLTWASMALGYSNLLVTKDGVSYSKGFRDYVFTDLNQNRTYETVEIHDEEITYIYYNLIGQRHYLNLKVKSPHKNGFLEANYALNVKKDRYFFTHLRFHPGRRFYKKVGDKNDVAGGKKRIRSRWHDPYYLAALYQWREDGLQEILQSSDQDWEMLLGPQCRADSKVKDKLTTAMDIIFGKDRSNNGKFIQCIQNMASGKDPTGRGQDLYPLAEYKIMFSSMFSAALKSSKLKRAERWKTEVGYQTLHLDYLKSSQGEKAYEEQRRRYADRNKLFLNKSFTCDQKDIGSKKHFLGFYDLSTGQIRFNLDKVTKIDDQETINKLMFHEMVHKHGDIASEKTVDAIVGCCSNPTGGPNRGAIPKNCRSKHLQVNPRDSKTNNCQLAYCIAQLQQRTDAQLGMFMNMMSGQKIELPGVEKPVEGYEGYLNHVYTNIFKVNNTSTLSAAHEMSNEFLVDLMDELGENRCFESRPDPKCRDLYRNKTKWYYLDKQDSGDNPCVQKWQRLYLYETAVSMCRQAAAAQDKMIETFVNPSSCKDIEAQMDMSHFANLPKGKNLSCAKKWSIAVNQIQKDGELVGQYSDQKYRKHYKGRSLAIKRDSPLFNKLRDERFQMAKVDMVFGGEGDRDDFARLKGLWRRELGNHGDEVIADTTTLREFMHRKARGEEGVYDFLTERPPTYDVLLNSYLFRIYEEERACRNLGGTKEKINKCIHDNSINKFFTKTPKSDRSGKSPSCLDLYAEKEGLCNSLKTALEDFLNKPGDNNCSARKNCMLEYLDRFNNFSQSNGCDLLPSKIHREIRDYRGRFARRAGTKAEKLCQSNSILDDDKLEIYLASRVAPMTDPCAFDTSELCGRSGPHIFAFPTTDPGSLFPPGDKGIPHRSGDDQEDKVEPIVQGRKPFEPPTKSPERQSLNPTKASRPSDFADSRKFPRGQPNDSYPVAQNRANDFSSGRPSPRSRQKWQGGGSSGSSPMGSGGTFGGGGGNFSPTSSFSRSPGIGPTNFSASQASDFPSYSGSSQRGSFRRPSGSRGSRSFDPRKRINQLTEGTKDYIDRTLNESSAASLARGFGGTASNIAKKLTGAGASMPAMAAGPVNRATRSVASLGSALNSKGGVRPVLGRAGTSAPSRPKFRPRGKKVKKFNQKIQLRSDPQEFVDVLNYQFRNRGKWFGDYMRHGNRRNQKWLLNLHKHQVNMTDTCTQKVVYSKTHGTNKNLIEIYYDSCGNFFCARRYGDKSSNGCRR